VALIQGQHLFKVFSTTYNKIVILGDFSMDANEAAIHYDGRRWACYTYDSPTCFKAALARIAASVVVHLRQVSVTSIIWCIPSSKLLLIDYSHRDRRTRELASSRDSGLQSKFKMVE